ncbi:MAG: N-acetylglutaminylglutamine synthetase [Desulfobacterales bacterium]|nr:N-acetylglutaminylglutamine synthetase [Desulfobacterales bacterium]
MDKNYNIRQRFERVSLPSLRNWGERYNSPETSKMLPDVTVNMGWGKIIFAHTFSSSKSLLEEIMNEKKGTRDITFYLRDPHVILSYAPDKLFLDPSHTYRLWSHDYRPDTSTPQAFNIRRISSHQDAVEINRIFASHNMVTGDIPFMLDKHATKVRTYLVAETKSDKKIVGTVTGLDHAEVFNDPENGASLWNLAVDSQTNIPGIGEGLVRHLAGHYFARGRNYIDLSVMHDNHEAIQLYEKIGFQRVPVFCIKRKNPINQSLFVARQPEENLNPYAKIIINEVRKRGIECEVIDEEYGYFKLKQGAVSITCRESLSELTSAIALSRCDDKRLTTRILKNAGLNVPRQYKAGDKHDVMKILKELKRVVVKPARGEQGNGISVDIRSCDELEKAIETAKRYCDDIIIEELIEGEDLRIVVINYKVVAGAIRKPPVVTGTGHHTLLELVEKYNRRRKASTGGESSVPFDSETDRCINSDGYGWDSVPAAGESICLRKTANLHTGGTIHDVTEKLHPKLIEAAESAARAIEIPVTGLDFLIKDISLSDYHIIEANERPGLANHEPQPTAERFVDLLFPQSVSETDTGINRSLTP